MTSSDLPFCILESIAAQWSCLRNLQPATSPISFKTWAIVLLHLVHLLPHPIRLEFPESRRDPLLRPGIFPDCLCPEIGAQKRPSLTGDENTKPRREGISSNAAEGGRFQQRGQINKFLWIVTIVPVVSGFVSCKQW